MTKLGIVTGMAFEADILHAAADRLAEAQRPIIVCHGFGRSASRRAALEAVSLGAEALLSFGIAGGLDLALKAGNVIAATAVRDGTTTIRRLREISVKRRSNGVIDIEIAQQRSTAVVLLDVHPRAELGCPLARCKAGFD